MPYKDPEKRQSYCKQYRTDHLDKRKQDGKARYYEVKAFIRKAKEKPCADCGISYPYFVMDFDHIQNKTAQVSEIRSLRKAETEITKCEVVCANCHRFRTHLRRK